MLGTDFNQINSVDACYALSRILKSQIKALENRAIFLQQKRKKIPVDPTEINDMMKAAKAILMEPSYFTSKAFLIRKYSDRYKLKPENLREVVKLEETRIKQEQANQRRLTTLIMHSKGKPNKDIARAVGLTKGRISQIISDHKMTNKM